MASYNQLYGQLVNKFEDSVGEVAITQAEKVSNVELDESGYPKEDVGQRDIEELLEQFEEIMKGGAYGIGREAVREAFEEDKTVKDLDLSSNITPREVKAEQFASAL